VDYYIEATINRTNLMYELDQRQDEEAPPYAQPFHCTLPKVGGCMYLGYLPPKRLVVGMVAMLGRDGRLNGTAAGHGKSTT
jgi:hypothetical protein